MFSNHVNKNLSAYYHDELSPEDARRVTEHLLHCRRCRKEYEEIKLGVRLASQLLPDAAPAALWADLESKLDQAQVRSGGIVIESDWKRLLFSRLSFKIAACLILIMIGIGIFLAYSRRSSNTNTPKQGDDANGPGWAVRRIAGQPRIGERRVGETGKMAMGEWLTTDDSSRAQISVGEIGEVKIEPNSRIRIIKAHEDEHRLALARGKMLAFIWAPPGQFYVDTPSAVAVDLGCSYTLEVNDDGQGLLRVTLGWVAFESGGRESFVPADAECVTRPGLGPGTPYFSDASAEFQSSLARFDTARDGDAARADALDAVLARSRKRDALTLWHLFARTNETERGRIYDQLSKLIPPPKKVTRDGIIRGDRIMLDGWWDKLGLGNTDWWRMWKGPLPSQAK